MVVEEFDGEEEGGAGGLILVGGEIIGTEVLRGTIVVISTGKFPCQQNFVPN